MLQRPFHLTKLETLKRDVDYCTLKLCSKNSKLIQQAMTSNPFRAASSSQSSHLVNVFDICCGYSASISSLLWGVQSLSGWLTERGSGSCQRSMIDILEMEHSQWGFYCHSWTCRGLQNTQSTWVLISNRNRSIPQRCLIFLRWLDPLKQLRHESKSNYSFEATMLCKHVLAELEKCRSSWLRTDNA